MNIILTNAFSINMLPPGTHQVLFEDIKENQVIALLTKHGFQSAVGHPATASILSYCLGLDIANNRMNVLFPPVRPEDEREVEDQHLFLIVAQLAMPRLAEGQVLSEAEMAVIPIRWVSVKIEESVQ